MTALAFAALTAFFAVLSLAGPGFAADHQAGNRGTVLDNIKSLHIYTVQDGERRQQAFTREMLRGREHLQLKGYVSGLLVLCEKEMEIRVADQVMSKIKCNDNGTFSVKHFGELRPDELMPGPDDRGYYEQAAGKWARAGLQGTGYSFFPAVTGDTVSPEHRFSIAFLSDGAEATIPVIQNSYIDLRQIAREQGAPLSFRYIGDGLGRLTGELSDLDARLQAIASGVAGVEAATGMELIRNINVLEYGDLRNAVTSERSDDMWLYMRTLREEPLRELETIAAHEALHKCVNRLRLTADAGMRKLFADLKGYDVFSNERFLLTTTGAVMPGAKSQAGEADLLAFVNEKNFFAGMKGGHAQANLDEFCASFLHTLLFIEKLAECLERPLLVAAANGEGQRSLSAERKEAVLAAYTRTIETMSKAFRPAAPAPQQVRDLLANALLMVRPLQQDSRLVLKESAE